MNSNKRAVIVEILASCAKPLFAVLEDISIEQLQWKPAPESRSIGEIFRHIIRVDAWYLKRLGCTPVVSDAKSGTVEELTENLRKIQQQIHEAVMACAQDEDLVVERISLDGNDKEKLGVVALHIAQHDLYHLAQVIYLRRAQDRNWASPHESWDKATHVIGNHLLGL